MGCTHDLYPFKVLWNRVLWNWNRISADRRYCKKLCFFYKIVNVSAPAYLSSYLPDRYSRPYLMRANAVFNTVYSRTTRYQHSFFSFCISHWNFLDSKLRNLPSVASFKLALSRFYRTSPSPTYSVNQPKGTVLLNRLRVGFSHLKEYKFRHNFQDIIDPFRCCSTYSIETTEHCLLHCSDYFNSSLQSDIWRYHCKCFAGIVYSSLFYMLFFFFLSYL